MTGDPRTTVAFSGHRTYRGEADAALYAAVGELYARGYRTFLCGMAVGFDLAAAEAVLACRGHLPAGARDVGCACIPSAGPDPGRAIGSAMDAEMPSAPGTPPVQPQSSVADRAMPPGQCQPSVPDMALPPVHSPSVVSGTAMPSAYSSSIVADAAMPSAPAPAPAPLPGLALVAVVPFAGQEARFSAADRERFRRVLAAADSSVVLSPAYHPGCYAVRNNYLVDHASLLVAWYDGSPGGTHYTVRRALRRGVELVNLHRAVPGFPQPEPTLF